jgi:hypothetical protein
MLSEHSQVRPRRRLTLQPAPTRTLAPATPLPLRPRPGATLSAASNASVEATVLEILLKSEANGAGLLDVIASHTAEALQQTPQAEACPTAAELRGIAARIATGLAVALLESDLPERIGDRLAAEAPFSEGWRSCPE